MSRHRATPAEVEQRRALVLRCRFARMGEAEIARRLAVSTSTVSRDLEAIHKDWGSRFRDSFDLALEVAEAAELFGLLEAEALKELLRLDGQARASTGSRMRCLWAARSMREAKLDLLAGAGLLTVLPPLNRLPRAAEIRAAFQAARLEDRKVVSSAELAVLNSLRDSPPHVVRSATPATGRME